MCGDDGKKVTPVPMPHTEVKLLSAEGSEGFPLVRLGRCHANRKYHLRMVLFLFYKENNILKSPIGCFWSYDIHEKCFFIPILAKGYKLASNWRNLYKYQLLFE